MYGDRLTDLDNSDGNVSGYVSSLEDALFVLKSYERETTSRFVCFKRPRSFGKQGTLGKLLYF